MIGHTVRGTHGFVPKEGTNFNRRLNVRLHDDVVERMESIRKPAESLADVVRAAIAAHLEKTLRERERILNREGAS